MQIVWVRLASFGHLGLISDPEIVSKFQNEAHDPTAQENSDEQGDVLPHSPAVVKSNMFLKRLSFGSKECTKELFIIRLAELSI